ncbi:MAG: HNH endonuclease [Bacteroidales bacterium]|nr:HNH endonuclease [Bacteroidales bacterium]
MNENSPHISKSIFVEILQDKELIRPDDILIFQTIYSLEKQEASATELARIIGWTDKNGVVGRIVGLGKRILKKYEIKQRVRENGTKAFWDFFFTGYDKGNFFIYQLKPELKSALEECGLTKNIGQINLQNAFLFAWNPDNWKWIDLEKNLEELKNTGKVTLKWSCISHNKVRPGDRAFLIRLGVNPKGLIGSGKVISEPFLSPHWGDKDKDVHRVLIEFDVLIDAEKEQILLLENLKNKLKNQNWTPQSSGISIKNEIIPELEKEWFNFLATTKLSFNPFEEKTDNSRSFVEGSALQVTQTRYERNIEARNECLKHYGFTCVVCGFNFEKTFGNLGYKFIHVHHLTEVSRIKKEYNVNPIADLRPVCPNCHAMLHKQNPAITIEELKEIITNQK